VVWFVKFVRYVEKEFIRLNERWIEFQLRLENAPAAALRRFVQQVLEHEMPMLKAVIDAYRSATADSLVGFR
jgi:hypothetical protein